MSASGGAPVWRVQVGGIAAPCDPCCRRRRPVV